MNPSSSSGNVGQDEFARRVVDEMARVIGYPQEARVVLGRAGFPVGKIPASKANATAFWHEIQADVNNGRLEGGMGPILIEASRLYPENRVFREALASVGGGRWRADGSRREGIHPVVSWVVVVGMLVGIAGVATLAMSEQEHAPPPTAHGGAEGSRPDAAAASTGSTGGGVESSVEVDEGPSSGSANGLSDAPRGCVSDDDCGPGSRCRLPRAVKREIGVVNKKVNERSVSRLVDFRCPAGMRRRGSPKGRVRGDGQCRVQWRHQGDERRCEVDVFIEGDTFREVRCEVAVMLRRSSARAGTCRGG